jgi:hydroxysqualene synthase
MTADSLSSGKDSTDENFPVASALIAARHRPVVMAFYKVARMADDIADHTSAPPAEKLQRLAAIEASLTGEDDGVAEAAHLRRVLEARAITGQHMLDLLEAFRRDVTKTRYVDWAQLMDYCRYSAAPVGRFMLDVHGENRSTWPASDALCAALQVINHLQDCGKDYREINRVYVPLDALAGADLTVEALAAPKASAALRGVIADLARRTQGLLDQSRGLASAVRDTRLSLEIGVIHRLAVSLNRRLIERDPLSERVHHRPHEALGGALLGAAGAMIGRLGVSAKTQTGAIGAQ